MSLGNQALRKATANQRFQFDEQTYSIRRNLMVFSSLSIALTFVSPIEKTGKYEVNMGIIKGVIDNPTLVYVFLAITCGYYLVWFYIHCQRLVVNNYTNIQHSFTASLAQLYAKDKFQKFTKEFEPKFQGVPSFISKGGRLETWGVSGHLNNHAVRNYPEMVKNIQEKSEFSVVENKDGFDVSYVHNLDDKDLIYLNCHLDQFWRIRKEEFFVAVLPVAYSALSIVLIAFHVWELLKS